jgi:hypothetical protein
MPNWITQNIQGKIEYPQVWESSRILVRVISPLPPVWRKAGYLKIEVLIEGEYFLVGYKPIEFGNNLIDVGLSAYRLSFDPVNQLTVLYPNTSISIYQLTRQDYSNMGINYQQVDKVTGGVVDTVYVPTTTSGNALAADLLRHEGTIYNRTNRTIYVSWGTTAATVTSLAVAAGANLDMPEDFTGAVQILAAAGVLTGNVLIQTVSYV